VVAVVVVVASLAKHLVLDFVVDSRLGLDQSLQILVLVVR
jgi:hypothetical protein